MVKCVLERNTYTKDELDWLVHLLEDRPDFRKLICEKTRIIPSLDLT